MSIITFLKIVPTARNSPIVEDMLRAACTVLGSSVALSISPLRAQELNQNAILNTTSQAWRIGRAIAVCRKAKYDIYFLSTTLLSPDLKSL